MVDKFTKTYTVRGFIRKAKNEIKIHNWSLKYLTINRYEGCSVGFATFLTTDNGIVNFYTIDTDVEKLEVSLNRAFGKNWGDNFRA